MTRDFPVTVELKLWKQGDFVSSDIQPIYEPKKLNWAILSVLIVLHAGAIAALFMFSWRALLVSVVLYWVSVGLGISMGYHRLHTHRSYKLPLVLEYFFAFCGTLSLEGGPIFWVATHRIHHQYSDKPGDPHSPRDGAWWSHIGWLLIGESKHNNTKLMSKYAPDLAKDRFYTTLNTYHWVPIVVVSALLLIFGGLPMLLWGTCMRLTFGLHATWTVNSVTHMWGTPPLHHSRRFPQQRDHRPADLRRRLAQQSPRASHVGAPWPGLV